MHPPVNTAECVLLPAPLSTRHRLLNCCCDGGFNPMPHLRTDCSGYARAIRAHLEFTATPQGTYPPAPRALVSRTSRLGNATRGLLPSHLTYGPTSAGLRPILGTAVCANVQGRRGLSTMRGSRRPVVLLYCIQDTAPYHGYLWLTVRVRPLY